jgi:hypothetical protein
VSVPKRLLHGVELSPPREAFDGRDRSTVRLGRQHEARLHRIAVEQHRTGAADTLFAADVRAVELQLVA